MITALKTMGQILGDTANIYGGTSGALQYGFNDSVTNAFGDAVESGDGLRGRLRLGRDPLLDEVEGRDGLQRRPRSPRSRRARPRRAVEISGDLFVTFRDTPAIEAFVKFLATPAAANAWAKQGGFATGNHNVSLERVPGHDRPRRPAGCPDGEVGRLRHVRRAARVVRLHHGSGRMGHLPDVPEEPEQRQRGCVQLEKAAAAAYKKGS